MRYILRRKAWYNTVMLDGRTKTSTGLYLQKAFNLISAMLLYIVQLRKLQSHFQI